MRLIHTAIITRHSDSITIKNVKKAKYKTNALIIYTDDCVYSYPYHSFIEAEFIKQDI